ncbi:MAG: SH3 domain-containing protein [Pseudomonadota bacterium]|nr:SH3 domain-containing protein [Pseudomonadota bacterium]
MNFGTKIALSALIAAVVGFATPISAPAETGLPLPRYASLRADKVNMRTGPGRRYPVDWIFVHAGLPIEIVSEFENWRKVRDWQGTKGWVHQSMLSGKRTVVVKGGLQPLRRAPHLDSPMTARVMEKVIGRILECEGDWCRIAVGKKRGWMRHAHFWGVYPHEKVN